MIITCARADSGATRIIRDRIEGAEREMTMGLGTGEGKGERRRGRDKGTRKYNVMQIQLITWSTRNGVH